MSEPITRSEMYLAALGGEAVTPPEPITRMDMYLAYLNGMTDTYPDPITRTEQYLYKLCQNGMGGGGGVTIRNQNKTITANGSYKADNGYTGIGTAVVNVPQQEPVVQALDVTENGAYNPPAGVDGFAPVTVNVAASGGGDTAKEDGLIARTLTEYTNDRVTSVGSYAFSSSTSLKSVNLPNAQKTGTYSFQNCSALTTVHIPNATTVDESTFKNCSACEEFVLPKVTALNKNVFHSCTALKRVVAPLATSAEYNVFFNTKNLMTLDLPKMATIHNGFLASASVKILVLRRDGVCSISNSATSFAPYVIVPRSRISDYENATNWSTMATGAVCQFLAVEDYTVDGTVSGELDNEKIAALLS